MPIDVKPLSSTQYIIHLAGQRQKDLEDVSIQIATGSKYTDFKGYAGEGTVERFLSYSSSTSIVDGYLKSNEIVASRLKTMSENIGQLQSIASDVANLIAQRRNSASGADIPVDVQGESILNSIAGKLNVRFDSRYLFGGSKTDTQPVQNVQVSNLDGNGEPTASYYRGDSESVTAKISDSLDLHYGVTANEEAFQQLIGAVHLLMDGHENNDNDTLSDAVDMINEAISSLASIRATVESSIDTIDKTNAEHHDISLLVEQKLIDLSQTDIVEATTRMSQLEATVQATYLAFSRLNSLRLSNYLN